MPPYTELLNQLSAGVQIIDPEMRYVFLNRVLLQEIAKSSDEMLSRFMHDVFPGIETTEIYEVIQEVIRTKKNRSVVNEFTFPDGKVSYYRLEVPSIPEGAIVFSWDVTDEKETELLLREASNRWQEEASQHEETLRKVLDSSLDGVQYFKSVRDHAEKIIDFEYVFSNKVACDIIGKTEHQVRGKRLLTIIPGHLDIVSEYGRSLFDLYSEVVETGISKELLFHFESDGIVGWFSNKSVKLGDGFVVTFSVVTELVNKSKELERLNASLKEEVQLQIEKNRQKDEALIQQSKLAAMGDMLSAIAHQWRQPLHAVLLGIELSREIVEKSWSSIPGADQQELNELYKVIEERIKYLSDTIEDFRDFYGPSQKVQDFDLEDAVQASVRFFEGQLHSRGIVLTVDGVTRTTLHGNANQFRQILLSLISNSIEAVSANARSDKWISFRKVAADPGTISLIVEDNGGGIRSDVIARIFEPYFTTKGPSGGTGMGLYIAKLILEKSFHGTIEAENGNEGARFILRIPVGSKT
ncbi:MAG TPA: hypothetical protein DEA96_15835 [Leptospiraceae bacterium]|nr:hypothetical protein [Spirochaetaceae bacterium]HBS06439.1 hypothetical protein [Leptospiraceae bacterium]|tara:strand:- start:15616 stop:17193 length:1578 start_codon:yes stop_codon:yes gene_type:complete